jgi:hypothetical protein
MNDGQLFYLACVAGLLLGVLLEHLWARRKP